jgi:hypothetical protein
VILRIAEAQRLIPGQRVVEEPSTPTTVTVAPRITAPPGSETVTINLPRAAAVCAACDGKTTRSARSKERMIDRTATVTAHLLEDRGASQVLREATTVRISS